MGGDKLDTTLSTLRSQPGSMLAAMFSGRHAVVKDNDGRAFIDRNGMIFGNCSTPSARAGLPRKKRTSWNG